MPPKTVRFPESLERKIQAKADKLDRSFSWVVINACYLAIEGEQVATGRAVARGAIEAAKKKPTLADTWRR